MTPVPPEIVEKARGGVCGRAQADEQPEPGSTPVREIPEPQIAAEGFGDE